MPRVGRQSLRRPSGARDGCAPRFLPTARKGRGGGIPQSTVRPHLVIIVTPPRELVAHIADREEHFHVQTLVAQSAVERFNVAILDRLPRPNEIQLYTILIGPGFHRPTVKILTGCLP